MRTRWAMGDGHAWRRARVDAIEASAETRALAHRSSLSPPPGSATSARPRSGIARGIPQPCGPLRGVPGGGRAQRARVAQRAVILRSPWPRPSALRLPMGPPTLGREGHQVVIARPPGCAGASGESATSAHRGKPCHHAREPSPPPRAPRRRPCPKTLPCRNGSCRSAGPCLGVSLLCLGRAGECRYLARTVSQRGARCGPRSSLALLAACCCWGPAC